MKFLKKLDHEFYRGLKWLVTLRAIFGIVLFASGFISRQVHSSSVSIQAFGLVFFISLLIILFSVVYAIFLPFVRHGRIFAYIQIVMDSFFVTLIILATGGPDSFFHFLYLLVIMYSSLLLGRRASIIVAFASSLEYSFLIVVESCGILGFMGNAFYSTQSCTVLLYKIATTCTACILVAFLGSILADQAKQAKHDLKSMSEHVKRVEKLAFAGEMAAGLAHEIKNPLAALSGSVQILKDEISASSDNYRLIQIIMRETERLNCLVTEFMSLAKPGIGEVRPVFAGDILVDVLDLFKKDSNWTNIEFLTESDPECWICIDPGHLRQVIWNLIINAADAIRDSGRNGIIKVGCSMTSDKRVVIKVKDNGIGMSPENMSSAFNPFFTTKPAGNGLGLCIVHRILENYDARIDISSKENHGTEFRIFLKKAEYVSK